MNGNLTINSGEWVKLTSGPVKAITIQNIGFNTLFLAGGSTAPSDDSGIRLAPGEALSAGTPLAEVFPGAGETMDVFARATTSNGRVFVSHA